MKAQSVLDIMKVARGMFEQTPAPDLESHYITFLEMLYSNNQQILRNQTNSCRRSHWEDARFVQRGSFPK